MFQRTCHRPEGVLEKAVRAKEWRGAPCRLRLAICRSNGRIAFVTELFERARKARAADTALGGVPHRAPVSVAGSRLRLAAPAGLASASGPSRHRGAPAGAEASDVARAP